MTIEIAAIGTLSRAIERPKAEGYNILVGGQWFRMIASKQAPLTIGTRDSLAQRSDDDGSIYQNVLDIGYAWGRTDLSGGEGLDWSPREIALEQNQVALDTVRYWDSNGIDISRPDHKGDQYTLRLARTFTESGITPVAPVDMAVSAKRIYIADGQTIISYTDWDGTSPVVGTGLPAEDVVALAASPNGTVMAVMADGSVWRKPPLSDAYAEIYTSNPAGQQDARGIWYVNGRFVMSAYDLADTAQLWELAWDGTDYIPVAAFDTAAAPFWSVVESGPAIVAACGDGTIRTYTPTTDDTALALLPRSRFTMPEGEDPFLLGANAGVLLIMSAADIGEIDREEIRLYQAEVLDARFNFVVGQLQLKREWTGAEHESITTRNMTNTRDEMFFFVKEEVVDTVGESVIKLEALWRFDVVTSGMSRILTAPIIPNQTTDGQPPEQDEQINWNGVVVFDDKLGAIDFTARTPGAVTDPIPGPRIDVSDPDKLQTFGWLIFPNITFGLNTPISWIATIVEAQNLIDEGQQVELWRSSDPQGILDWQDPSWVLEQRLSSQGGSNFEHALQNISSRTLALQLRLYSTEQSTRSPHVSRIAVRGIPAHRDFIMMVPFNISDYVSVPGRKPSKVPGLGNTLHEQVLNLVGQNVEATILDPRVRFQGIVNNVSEPVEFLADRGSVTRHVMVEFRGKRLPGTAVTATGDDGIGLGTIGIATIGIGQTEGT